MDKLSMVISVVLVMVAPFVACASTIFFFEWMICKSLTKVFNSFNGFISLMIWAIFVAAFGPNYAWMIFIMVTVIGCLAGVIITLRNRQSSR